MRKGRAIRWEGFGWLCGLWIGLQTALPAVAQLSLPFFDDFSTAAGYPGIDVPNTERWQPGSGVYINNTMTANHPTVGIATFDGLNANGFPYIRDNELGQGYTDTLSSKPINLAGLTAADSVYLSFYWQSRGLGELPDAGDSLTVQFLTEAGQWETVWRIEGGQPNNNYTLSYVPIRQSRFFHAGFAFRFRTYGRESGPFDTWHIDYVYLNKGRSTADRFVRDVAVRKSPGPLFRRYSALPLAQYLANPNTETADSVTTDINNLFNNFNFTTFRFSVQNERTGQLLQDSPSTQSTLIPALQSQPKIARPQPFDVSGAEAIPLRYTFDVLTTDDQNPSIPGVNLRQNDTISGHTTLGNYYAYDDGSWEYALRIGPRERWAVRFVLNKPDVIAGINASIVPFQKNQTGAPFQISIFNSRNGRPGTVLYQQSFSTTYPDHRNGFVYFPFRQGVAITDTFYVGYQRVSTSDTVQLLLGFDKNSPFGQQLFYNGGVAWEQNMSNPALSQYGAFMLRPVMGGQVSNVITATEPTQPADTLYVFPNPTTGLIQWNEPGLTGMEVYSLDGRLLHTVRPVAGQQTADLHILPPGLYVLHLRKGKQTAVQRLLIQ